MAVVVQKYGGSSVADAQKLRKVAERVIRTRSLGHQVVVVVSAMGNTTDELLARSTTGSFRMFDGQALLGMLQTPRYVRERIASETTIYSLANPPKAFGRG